MFRHDIYPVAAEAVTDCTLIRIEADAFLRQIPENAEVAISILSATFVHLHGLVAQVASAEDGNLGEDEDPHQKLAGQLA